MAIPMAQMKVPSFDDTTSIMTGVTDGVAVIGLHTPDKETWILPVSVFAAMLDVYLEVYTPNDGETLQ